MDKQYKRLIYVCKGTILCISDIVKMDAVAILDCDNTIKTYDY